ncbi:MAG: acyltransferase [Oscillospiraceae bacterium]|jgi:surface polysaccharide O-acyltransferase-like enzyme|nr:acyltransferase [Oscillospiraceae bacterium]
MKPSRTRYNGLDALKLICSFLVIVIHLAIPSTYYYYLRGMARIAVPVFFLITGYFYVNTSRKKRKQQIIRILKLLIISLTAYLLLGALHIYIFGGIFSNLSSYLSSFFSPSSIFKLLVFNQSHESAVHLWYLSALLYVLIVYYLAYPLPKKYVFIRKNKYLILTLFTIVLLLINLSIGEFSPFIFGKKITTIAYSRNFLFTGLPYFSLGILLHSPFIKSLLNQIKPSVALAVTIFVLIFYLAELRFIDRPLDNYFSTAILSLSGFVFFAKLKINDTNPIAICGRKYSLGIYITHPVVQCLDELGVFNGSVMMHLRTHHRLRPYSGNSNMLLQSKINVQKALT